jgi:hypothetical protein
VGVGTAIGVGVALFGVAVATGVSVGTGVGVSPGVGVADALAVGADVAAMLPDGGGTGRLVFPLQAARNDNEKPIAAREHMRRTPTWIPLGCERVHHHGTRPRTKDVVVKSLLFLRYAAPPR